MSDNWNYWTETRSKSVSNVPKWLQDAIEKYQKQEDLQSWSAALLELAAIAVQKHHETIEFGDSAFEREFMERYHEFEAGEAERGNHNVWIDDFMRTLVAPPQHGGDRKSGK